MTASFSAIAIVTWDVDAVFMSSSACLT